MLYYNFTRLFKARGIDKPYSFLCHAGYSENTATRIANNKVVQLNLKTIEHLCSILYCTPNDFMEWIPAKNVAEPGKHPLAPLRRTETITEVTRLLNQLPLDRLQEIGKQLTDEINKHDGVH